MSITHDQNFKNLIIDYPLQALQFFSAEEAARLDPDARIIPIRQELLKDRLSDRFFETDVPLLVQWSDGTREALLFLLEEESSPTRFSIHRLAIYCLQLADQYETDRVIPVVIFLTNQEPPRESLQLGYKDRQIMHFEPLMFRLGALRSVDHLASRNVVARIALPCMRHASQAEQVIAAGEGLKGLIELEPDPEKRLKYQEFIQHYTKLDEDGQRLYAQLYATEEATMRSIAEQLRAEGRQDGIRQGIQQGLQEGILQGRQEGLAQGEQEGRRQVLTRLIEKRFGQLDTSTAARLQTASTAELDQWAERILDAEQLEDVFRVH